MEITDSVAFSQSKDCPPASTRMGEEGQQLIWEEAADPSGGGSLPNAVNEKERDLCSSPGPSLTEGSRDTNFSVEENRAQQVPKADGN